MKASVTRGTVAIPRRLLVVDPFPLIVIGGILLVIAVVVVVAQLYPGSGSDILDWRPTRSYETELELEAQDVQQMIDAQNEYRRKRGERELTEDEIRFGVAREKSERANEHDG
jgi:hypothetical protein